MHSFLSLTGRCFLFATTLVVFFFVTDVTAFVGMPYRPGYALGSWVPQSVLNALCSELDTRTDEIGALLGESFSFYYDNAQISKEEEETVVSSRDAATDAISSNTSRDHPSVAGNSGGGGGASASSRGGLDDAGTAGPAPGDVVDGDGDGKGKPHLQMLKKRYAEILGKYRRGWSNLIANPTKRRRHVPPTPVNWPASSVTTKPRGYGSSYIDVKFVPLPNVSDGIGHAKRVADGLLSSCSVGESSMLFGKAAKLAYKKTANVSRQYRLRGTVLVSGFTTYRYSRQFESLVLAKDALLAGWNYFWSKEAISHPVINPSAFCDELIAELRREEDENAAEVNNSSKKSDSGSGAGSKQRKSQQQARRIYFVNELKMGALFVGLLHVSEVTERSDSRRDEMVDTVIRARMEFTIFLGSLSGRTSITTEQAERLVQLAKIARYAIIFEIISLGFRPSLSSHATKEALDLFRTFDPGAFKARSGSGTTARSTLQARRQSNMAAVIKATVEGIHDTIRRNPKISVQSFLEAFDDFTSADDPNSGEPVAFGLEALTKLDVQLELAAHVYPREQWTPNLISEDSSSRVSSQLDHKSQYQRLIRIAEHLKQTVGRSHEKAAAQSCNYDS